jgi:hypothetical protein
MSTKRSKETRKPIAKLNASVGARFHTEPLSEWSRKLLVFLLLLSAVTWLLFLGIVVPRDTNIVGTVAWNKPGAAVIVAVLTIIYALILFKVSCEQDIAIWKFGNQPTIDAIKARIRETHREYARLIEHGALTATQSELLQEIFSYDEKFVSDFQKHDRADALEQTALLVTKEQGTAKSLAFYMERLRNVDEHLEEVKKLGGKREQVWQIQRTIANNNLKADTLMAEQEVLGELLNRCIKHMRVRERTEVWGPAAFADFTAAFILTSEILAIL